jgi:hypothetical protein
VTETTAREIATGSKIEGLTCPGLFGLTFEEGAESAFAAEEEGVTVMDCGC